MGNHNLEIIGGLFLHIILDGLLYAVVMYRGGWLQYKCSGFNRAGSECLQFCEFSLVTNMSVIELYSGKKERNSLVYLSAQEGLVRWFLFLLSAKSNSCLHNLTVWCNIECGENNRISQIPHTAKNRLWRWFWLFRYIF